MSEPGSGVDVTRTRTGVVRVSGDGPTLHVEGDKLSLEATLASCDSSRLGLAARTPGAPWGLPWRGCLDNAETTDTAVPNASWPRGQCTSGLRTQCALWPPARRQAVTTGGRPRTADVLNHLGPMLSVSHWPRLSLFCNSIRLSFTVHRSSDHRITSSISFRRRGRHGKLHLCPRPHRQLVLRASTAASAHCTSPGSAVESPWLDPTTSPPQAGSGGNSTRLWLAVLWEPWSHEFSSSSLACCWAISSSPLATRPPASLLHYLRSPTQSPPSLPFFKSLQTNPKPQPCLPSRRECSCGSRSLPLLPRHYPSKNFRPDTVIASLPSSPMAFR